MERKRIKRKAVPRLKGPSIEPDPTRAQIRADLTAQGRRLLKLLVRRSTCRELRIDDLRTYLGYKETCDRLGLIHDPDMNVHWGRYLQQNGLTDLNEWTVRHKLPAIGGLVVNQGEDSDRFLQPGGQYFTSNGHSEMDFTWWLDQVRAAASFDWRPYV